MRGRSSWQLHPEELHEPVRRIAHEVIDPLAVEKRRQMVGLDERELLERHGPVAWRRNEEVGLAQNSACNGYAAFSGRDRYLRAVASTEQRRFRYGREIRGGRNGGQEDHALSLKRTIGGEVDPGRARFPLIRRHEQLGCLHNFASDEFEGGRGTAGKFPEVMSRERWQLDELERPRQANDQT